MDNASSTSTATSDTPGKRLQRVTPSVAKQIERQLGGRTRDIHLSDELADLFRERSWRHTAKIIRAWMFWVIVLDVVTLALNAILLPLDTVSQMLLPASILPPAALITALAFRKPRAHWQQGVFVVAGMCLILVSVAFVGVNSGGEFYERHLTIMLFVAVTAIVIFPIPLLWATMIGGFALTLYLVFQRQNPNIQVGSALAGALFFACGVAATIVARRTATILAQKTFLLELRDQIRLADLTEANTRLELLARTDPLTGVANRRSMMERLDLFWAKELPEKNAAMLMCDVDDFKRLNDNLGHAEGDRCLVKIAGIIQSCLRETDHVARYGGEEFLVFLQDCDEQEAVRVAEIIRGRVEAASLPNPTSRVVPFVSLSVGVATMERCSATVSAEDLQRQADEALYLAKKHGRNRVVVQPAKPD